MFLEVGVEAKHFTIVLEPRRLYPWYIVIFWCGSLFLEGKVANRLAHLVDQIFIDILFKELPFFLLRSVHEVELLSLVIILFVRVMENMAWEEGNLLGKVGLHSEVIFLLIQVINHPLIKIGPFLPRIYSFRQFSAT